MVKLGEIYVLKTTNPFAIGRIYAKPFESKLDIEDQVWISYYASSKLENVENADKATNASTERLFEDIYEKWGR